MKAHGRPILPRRFSTLLFLALASGGAHAQDPAHRQIKEMAASPSGSGILVAISEESSYGSSQLVFLSPATNKVLWQLGELPTIGSASVSPDGKIVAVGFVGVPDSAAGVFLLDVQTGKQVGALGFDEKLVFAPGGVYPRFGSGVSQLAYSPDGTLLYGLSNDTLFAWDVSAKHYLWIQDVPALIEAPTNQPDPLPYGHATGFALSPDGRQIAAVRDALRVATAGRAQPGHFIKREGTEIIQTAAFSSDSRILAAGEFGFAGKTLKFETELWFAGALHPVKIDGCGGGIAWTGTPDLFGCQNGTGAHLRNIHDPQQDIGVAGPVSDLPILKVGNSLWSSSYKRSDWKDPAKPLTITLGELGTGHQIMLTLPGR